VTSLVERMHKDEQDELEHKTGGRHGVNMLRESGGELAESRFDAFPKVLNQQSLGG